MNNTPFQKSMNLYPALGIAGQFASQNPFVFALGNPQADGQVASGSFVWLSPKGAKNSSEQSSKPLGIVAATLSYSNPDILDSASAIISSGQALTVVCKGDLYVMSSTAAEYGQKVFAKLSDGTILTAQAGSTIEGAVETDWTVILGGGAEELITISNWS